MSFTCYSSALFNLSLIDSEVCMKFFAVVFKRGICAVTGFSPQPAAMFRQRWCKYRTMGEFSSMAEFNIVPDTWLSTMSLIKGPPFFQSENLEMHSSKNCREYRLFLLILIPKWSALDAFRLGKRFYNLVEMVTSIGLLNLFIVSAEVVWDIESTEKWMHKYQTWLLQVAGQFYSLSWYHAWNKSTL